MFGVRLANHPVRLVLRLPELRDNHGLLMNVFRIAKRNGKFRTIYAPSPKEKEWLRQVLSTGLTPACERLDKANVAHGFRRGRSPVTNAMQHRGFDYSLCFDLQDFFDTVLPTYVPLEWANMPELWPDGAARQGLPTSPALANIAAAAFDADVCALRPAGPTRKFESFVYTRYADDLTFSFDNAWLIDVLLNAVPRLAEKHGFRINKSKTRLQWAGAGRRIITGVAVDNTLNVPRSVRRRLRAARHRRNTGEARGLAEWSGLRLPKEYERFKQLEPRNAGGSRPRATERRSSTSAPATAPSPVTAASGGRRFDFSE